MLVQSLIDKKGKDVHTIAAKALVTEAAKELARRRIGALVVKGANDTVAGILSERDIVRAMAERGHHGLQLRVEDLMTRDVKTCSPADTLSTALTTMASHRIRHLPVVDDGRLLGLLSVRDVMAERLDKESADAKSLLHVSRVRTPAANPGGRLMA